MTYEEAIEKMARAMNDGHDDQWLDPCRSQARAAAEAIGLRQMMEARCLSDDKIASVLTGVRRQVEWNGWEEPYVTERFKSELKALNGSAQ